MMITATEAAAVLGITPRAVRARLARGELRGRMQGGRWMVARDALPLDEAGTAAKATRADEIRQTVEAVLPPRCALPSRRAYHSVADVRSFQAGHALACALRRLPGWAGLPDPARRGATVGAGAAPAAHASGAVDGGAGWRDLADAYRAVHGRAMGLLLG